MAMITPRAFNPLINPVNARPVIVENEYPYTNHIFLARPLLGPLLFENTASDARDHLANERTFLSWVRLSIYLAIVSSAILVSFHLSSKPTHTERMIALPLGIVFWLISLGCLANGFALYLNTVMKYSRRAALVQSGWKTQIMFVVMSLVIIGCCILFLITRSQSQSKKKSY